MLGVPSTADSEKSVSLEPGGAERQEDEDKRDEFRRNHGILCRLFCEGSTTAMREVFNTIHPPISLHSRLTKAQITKSLRRLQQQGSLTPDQWRYLYPGEKSTPVSTNFNNRLLRVLLQYICHLSPPYPNGWEGIPLSTDTSLSADLVRLDYIRRSLNKMKGETNSNDLDRYSNLLIEVLTRIGGPIARIKADTIMTEATSQEEMDRYKEEVSQWQKYHDKMVKAGTDPISPQSDGHLLVKEFTLPQITTTHAGGDGPGVDQDVEGQNKASNRAGRLSLPGAGAHRSRSNSRAGSGHRTPVATNMLHQDRAILVEHHKLLTENIRSDVVLLRLVMAGLLSHEEKNSINLATRNVDRMKALLRLLPTKPRPAFTAFCEAIKFKYVSIYEQLMRAKRTAMEKPDDITEANMNLKSNYKTKMRPVSWHPRANVNVCQFYTPLYITDGQGNEYSPSTVFESRRRAVPGRGRRMLIEGESGSGKSIICRYITREWANGEGQLSDYRLVYYIDVKLLKNSLGETMLAINHGEAFNKTVRDIYQLIDGNQREVMFILDSLEDLSPKVRDEIMDLIQGKLFPDSSVMVTINSMYVTRDLMRYFDSKLVVMGLSLVSLEDFVMRYARLTKTPEDLYFTLVEKMMGEGGMDSDVQILAQNPQLCMCMCLLAETGQSLSIESMTQLLQAFLLAIQNNYCRRNRLEMVDGELPEVVQNLTQDIEEMAWRCMHQNGSFFTYDQSDEDDSQSNKYAFGFIEKRSSSTLLTLRQEFFSNRVFQDFMAARVLCRLEVEDFMDHVQDLVHDNYYCNVTRFLCGLLKDDKKTTRLSTIMKELAQVNVTHWRGYSSHHNTPTSVDGRLDTSLDTGLMEGRLGDFKLSLECINECHERDDMINIISQSLPTRMFTMNKKTLSHGGILGLAKCMLMDECHISELEFRLDHFARYHSKALLILAQSINDSQYMTSMKLHWVDADLLAGFLAHVFTSPCHITTITCRCEIKTETENRVAAAVWSNMRQAGENMSSVQSFTLTNCTNKAMVSCVLRSLPITIQHLTLTSCSLDLVSAQEVEMRLTKSSHLQTLDLTGINIHTVDFNHLSAGLKMSESIQELSLAEVQLGGMAIDSLAEALKFNRSLVHLDLSHNILADSACKSLASALPHTHHLKTLKLHGASMTRSGKEGLREGVRREGLREGVREEVTLHGMNSIQCKSPSFTLSKESTLILNQLSQTKSKVLSDD